MTDLTPEQALIRAADHGIHQMPVPTPFAVGRMNAYLIEGPRLTLVDVGPNSDRAFAELERHLSDLGRRVEEIDLILITHGHIDHVGLVEAVVGRSRAEVAALEIAVETLADFDKESRRQDDFAVELMLEYGVPEDISQALHSVSASFRTFGAPTKVTRPLEIGETIDLGDRELTALHRPGHSPFDTVFLDPASRYLFSGDHLIAHISSNPLLTKLPEPAEDRSHALADYLRSYRQTAELDVDVVLPGHGELILDHRTVIDARIRSHERRKRKIYDMIASRPQNAYEIAQALWGNVALTQTFLCISEVIGHTDLLLAEGSIVERPGPPVVFEVTDAGKEK